MPKLDREDNGGRQVRKDVPSTCRVLDLCVGLPQKYASSVHVDCYYHHWNVCLRIDITTELAIRCSHILETEIDVDNPTAHDRSRETIQQMVKRSHVRTTDHTTPHHSSIHKGLVSHHTTLRPERPRVEWEW